ncbi:hypothetical protein NHX12_021651 [Muraenolepis orangiensis]|uniref:Deleted in lung and esophageal cancer protein 1 n=1 Tax=Muraenolepis orangiensis TaxID=630683 RepID=A0A9Q0IW90_9TELE|nr:hypothetical protein NHX12_021651 [Muraenolepis orangiensis]
MDASPALLDFGDKVILKTDEVTLQLTITNHSAIAAPFTIEAEYFAAHAPAPSGPDSQSKKGLKYQWKPHFPSQVKKMEEKAHQEFVEALLSHEKGAAFLVRPGNGMLAPFDKRVVEVTAYSNMWGEYRDHLVCKVGDLEPRLIPVRMSVSGCPLYFQMFGPRPASAPIVRFGTCLSGGDTVSRSLRINNPSPYDIRMDWETYNVDDNDRQLVDVVMSCGDFFPLKDADGNELVGGALALPNKNQSVWGRERTPSSKRTSPSLSSEPDVVDDPHPTVEDSVVVEEDEGKGTLSPRRRQRKVFSVFIRPHVGLLSDYPYCITPQQTVIPAKGSATVHVSFTPLTLSGATANASCVGQALGFMSLDSRGAACIPGKVQRAQGLDLEPLRMDLQAVVKSALLTVQMEDDDGALEFHGSVRDLLQAESENRTSVRHFDVSQSMGLRNHLQMPLSFRLETQPPFSVLHPRPCARTSSSSNPPTGDGHPLLLQPQSVLKVKVSFHCSLSLLEQVQVLEEAPPTPVSHDSPVSSVSSVSPVRGGGGKRTLKFLQNLVIRYSNNSIQTVPLSARLDVPGPWLSRDSVDFGLCNVGQTQLAHVSLLSYDTDGCWRASIETRDEEDSHVFSVTPDCGVLRGPEPTPTTRGQQHLQISFTASEVREFRATVTIQGALIEPSLKLCLLGRGAYDKARRSSLVSFR